MEKNLQILSASPLFKSITTEDTRALLRCMDAQIKQYQKGSYVKSAGDDACHASNYSSHLRQIYRRINSISPSYRLS